MGKLYRSQKGDTIVEVLIAITVAATVLGLSLGTMNRNLRTSQRTKEQSQAVKYAQGQLEILKAATEDTVNANIPPGSNGFCFSPDGSSTITLGPLVPKPDVNDDDFGLYTGCKVTNGGAEYNIVIKKTDPGNPTNREYKIYVRWDEVGGTRSQVTYAYRTAR